MVDRFQGYLVKMGKKKPNAPKPKPNAKQPQHAVKTAVAEVGIFSVTCLGRRKPIS